MEKELKKVKSSVKNAQIAPRKLRLVIDLVRGKKVERAIEILKFLNKKGSLIVLKALNSAVASAQELYQAELATLVLSSIRVDEARKGRGVRFESKARYTRLAKRRSHINLEVTVK